MYYAGRKTTQQTELSDLQREIGNLIWLYSDGKTPGIFGDLKIIQRDLEGRLEQSSPEIRRTRISSGHHRSGTEDARSLVSEI